MGRALKERLELDKRHVIGVDIHEADIAADLSIDDGRREATK